jgi:hypothetical protein
MNYPVQRTHVLKKRKLILSRARIINHRFIPKTLDLMVVDWGFKVSLDFSFDNSSLFHSFGKYDGTSEALEAYEKIAKANKDKKLYVHVYGDGKTRLEIET